ncbi:MAG: hypothetical protein WDN28_04635 [Chthoniobacter sp.]
MKLPLDTDAYRSRVNMRVAASPMSEILELEPNDTPDRAQVLALPASVNGRLFVEDKPEGRGRRSLQLRRGARAAARDRDTRGDARFAGGHEDRGARREGRAGAAGAPAGDEGFMAHSAQHDASAPGIGSGSSWRWS